MLPKAQLKALFIKIVENNPAFRKFVNQHLTNYVSTLWLNLLRYAKFTIPIRRVGETWDQLGQIGTLFLSLIGFC